MHEMSLAQGVIEAIEAEAGRLDFSRVLGVTLEIGTLSHVDPEALRFGFETVMRDTIADKAALTILTPPGRAQCFGCGSDVEIARRGEGCPKCGSYQLVVTAGEDMKIKELEVA